MPFTDVSLGRRDIFYLFSGGVDRPDRFILRFTEFMCPSDVQVMSRRQADVRSGEQESDTVKDLQLVSSANNT